MTSPRLKLGCQIYAACGYKGRKLAVAFVRSIFLSGSGNFLVPACARCVAFIGKSRTPIPLDDGRNEWEVQNVMAS